MAGLNEVQKSEVRALIQETVMASLLTASNEAKDSIAQVVGTEVGQMREAAKEFERRATEHKTYHELITTQMAESMGSMQAMVLKLQQESGTTRESLQTMLLDVDRQVVALREQMSIYEGTKDAIVADLDNKQNIMEELSGRVHAGISEATGAWKTEMAAAIGVNNTKLTNAERIADAHQQKIAEIEVRLSQPGAVGAQGGGGGGRDSVDRAGKWRQRGLIYEKDLTVPKFPEAPKAEPFRNWLRDFGRYVGRHVDFPDAEILFPFIKTIDTTLEDIDAVVAFLQKASNLEGTSARFENSWQGKDQEKDLFEILEVVLKDKHDDVVKSVAKGRGFEVLRQLVRRFDPENPNLKIQLQARILMLIDHKCKNFKEVVERLALITRMVNEMREQGVDEPLPEVLATVLYNNMDASCIAELATTRLDVDEHVPDVGNFNDLRKYVQKRLARERILQPQVPVKMDVSAVGGQGALAADAPSAPTYGGEATPQAPWTYESDRHMQPSPYHDPSPGPWTEVGGSHLDAFGKGKGSGKDRGPMKCHNCDGESHPFRLCPSIWGVKDKPNQVVCDTCKGKGHNTSACPSPGGGKHEPKGKGKGDNGKGDWGKGGKGDWKGGKGKGKGYGGKGYGGKGDGNQSRYFQGKGSGVASFSDEWSQWSQSDWNAWWPGANESWSGGSAAPWMTGGSSSASSAPSVSSVQPGMRSMYSLGMAPARIDNDRGGGVADIMDSENHEFYSPSDDDYSPSDDDDNDDLFPEDDAEASQRQKSEPPWATSCRHDRVANDGPDERCCPCPTDRCVAFPLITPIDERRIQACASNKCLGFPLTNGPDERRTRARASNECLEFPLTDHVERRMQACASNKCLAFPLTQRRTQARASNECLEFPLPTTVPTRTSLQDVSLTSTAKRHWNTHASLRDASLTKYVIPIENLITPTISKHQRRKLNREGRRAEAQNKEDDDNEVMQKSIDNNNGIHMDDDWNFLCGSCEDNDGQVKEEENMCKESLWAKLMAKGFWNPRRPT